MTEYDFSGGDYKTALRDAIDACYERGGTTPERMAAADALTMAYVAQTGQRPDAAQLDRLATWILLGERDEIKLAKGRI